MNAQLFSPLKLRDITFKNRIAVSPMCMYSAENGVPNSWHMVHLGSRAVGGAGLIVVEATGVSPEGRISPGCLGLWNDQQMEAFKPIVSFMKEQGSVAGIQLAHAGRKASHSVSWKGSRALSAQEGGWQVQAPSAIPYSEQSLLPKEMNSDDILQLIEDFCASTQRALNAGFQVIELHMAHGYLMHEFLSPLSNHRQDEYGGSLENRMRLPLKLVEEVRKILPMELPLLVRISATDWAEGGWDLPQSIEFAKELKKRGVDLVDCSSGGNVPHQKIAVGPHYQVPFAEAIKQSAGIPTGAVGLITDPLSAEEILKSGKADLIFLARELLRDPYWPLHAAKKLGVDIAWPLQYERAK
ncbi:NADH:flavin oxidoreductase/NADH oxidase [Bdellovibrio svalbardensis]|uniref:NADH:flavin oxidoreductase/NADH oxidase n=1 Tax=Bdellovibrio svalbardensis TaxID=2972972 RepID=A0ABT6DML0_9BACT|nr:NADH:flavin oxidoreductase/NADH oxidase [Bdellovibrio svalbardensis]MDG0818107.1 NADH:flavin oxidoreductase/NADH oxidase [Bdellovibrio svalbardensis]